MVSVKDDHPARTIPPLEVVPDQWYAVLEAKALGRKPVSVRRFSEDLLLYRTASGGVVCMVDRCPHRGVPLSLGKVVGDDIECGYHAFRFRPDGACTAIPCDPASAKIPNAMRTFSFAAQEAYGLVWVFWGSAREHLPPIPWFDDVPAYDWSATDVAYVWPVPCYQAIEANFDFHHAPIVHAQRSFRFLPVRRCRRFDEVSCSSDDDRVDLAGVLREPGDPPAPDGFSMRCSLNFRMPGLAQLRFGSLLRLIVFDTPIDAGSTWRFLRALSPIGPAFGLGKLITWFLGPVNLRLGTQNQEDLPMAMNQGHAAGDVFNCVYVKADAGCAHYDRLRKKLLRAARARIEEYPPPVRLRLGPPIARERSLPMVQGVQPD